MEQTISTSTPGTTTGPAAAPAPQGAIAVTAAAPDGAAATDAATQFGPLLDALQLTAALAPVTEPGTDAHAGPPAKHAKAGETGDDANADAAATAAAAALVATLLAPVTSSATSAPTAGTPAGDSAGQPAAAPIQGAAAPQAAAAATLPVAGVADAAAPATAGAPAPVTAAVLEDGELDPALVQSAVTAAGTATPAHPAATAGASPRTAPAGAPTAAAEAAAATTAVTADPVTPTAAATTATAPVTDADAPDDRGADTGTGSNPGTGHGGRLDLQVQPAPHLKETAPAAPTQAPVAPIDRERLERLADGLAVRLRVSHAAEGARIRMQLEPRELGEVVVRLEIRDGVAHAHLIAESTDAGRALTSSLGDLRSALADRGLQLESVSVRVAGEGASNTADGQAGQPQADRRARAPLTFGRIDEAVTTAASDTADRTREGQAVWMLA
jgi:flagellar hook-length control protein FliK